MKISQVAPTDLIPADYNPRQISLHQLNALKSSITKFGFVEPVIVNTVTDRIVGGHQRVLAAVELQLEKVPVVKVKLTESDEKALNISLNQISGSWDEHVLTQLLSDLGSEGFDLSELGFRDDELHALIAAVDGEQVGVYDGEGSSELNPDDFDNFEHTCPRCSFGWND
jgi:ParB-like chromosome segregation protein Spo0J